jgi:aerotaxis receptor
MKPKTIPSNREIFFDQSEMIVSKTDLSGRLTYANKVFMRIADFPEEALLGVQHNIVRHPDMPRGAFLALWETLKSGQEFFGFVKNMARNGDHYWVFANITADMREGAVVGYFSVRRPVTAQALQIIEPVYRQMREIEQQAGAASAPQASLKWLMEQMKAQGTTYEKFVLDVFQQSQASA